MTEVARLRPYGPEHDAATVVWLNSGELRSTFGFQGVITLESHRRWVEAAKDVRIWAIVDGRDLHCGNTLLHVNARHRSAYFQIYIGEPRARGKGIGDAALCLALERAFDHLALHRVWLHTFGDNVAAESLYRKRGFILEGIERDAILTDGGFVTQNRWSMLAEEWRQVEARA